MHFSPPIQYHQNITMPRSWILIAWCERKNMACNGMVSFARRNRQLTMACPLSKHYDHCSDECKRDVVICRVVHGCRMNKTNNKLLCFFHLWLFEIFKWARRSTMDQNMNRVNNRFFKKTPFIFVLWKYFVSNFDAVTSWVQITSTCFQIIQFSLMQHSISVQNISFGGGGITLDKLDKEALMLSFL